MAVLDQHLHWIIGLLAIALLTLHAVLGKQAASAAPMSCRAVSGSLSAAAPYIATNCDR